MHEQGILGFDRARVIEDQLGLVTALARRFAHDREQLNDLIQVGAIGLINAVDRFDPQRGVELRAYAVPSIVGEIKRHLRDRSSTIRVPRREQEARHRLQHVRRDLARELKRAPTSAELASLAAVDPDDVARATGAERAAAPISLSPGGDCELLVEDEGYAVGENRELVREGFQVLDARERRALCLCYFEGLSQREAAARLGISQSQASRVISGALAKMRAALAEDASMFVAEATTS
jgi:RNA polymerase sigma-B factor